LKELQRANLIEVRREGRFLYYSPNFLRMNRLLGFLAENCCVLADKDCGPACGTAAADAAQNEQGSSHPPGAHGRPFGHHSDP
jgi:hypothetical protein